MRDRTGEVWELPTGASFVVVGPPRAYYPSLGLHHPYLALDRPNGDDDGPERGVVQELDLHRDTFSARGWRRLA